MPHRVESPSITAAPDVLHRLFEHTPGLVVLLRGPDHVFTYANRAYLDVVGGRPVLGRRVAEVLPEMVEQGFLEILDRCYRTGAAYRGEALEFGLRLQDGRVETRYFDFVYQPLRDDAGEVEAIFGQGFDVTERVAAEEALRDSEARFANIFEQVTVGIAQTDVTGRFLLVNDRMCELLGRSRDELLKLSMQAVTHPDDLAQNLKQFRRLVQHGEAFVVEKRYLRGDGGTVWVRNHVSLVEDAQGRPAYVTAVVVDIEDRKRAERELQRSQALSAAVLDVALDAIVTIGVDSQVLEWNPAAEATFGFSRAEALGRDLTSLIIPPELAERHRQGMANYLRTGQGAVIGRRVEIEGRRKDGRRIPVELAISPIRVDEEVLFTAHLRDISSRRRFEAALREGAQRLRATYEHAFAGIGEVDHQGRFTRVNEQFSAITGYSREELLQRSIWDLTHPDDTEQERPVFARQMAGDLPVYSFEKRYIHKDGHIIWIAVSASAVTDADGRPLYGVRVIQDVTERKRGQERQQLLIHELNHRVKNTLATVQSLAAQSARTTRDPAAAYESFMERLMALSRAHDVLTSQRWEGADLAAVVRQAVSPFAGASGERFEIQGPSAWLEPHAALALAMALHELATNAAKYGALVNSKGCVRISWDVEPGPDDSPWLRLLWREEGGPPVAPPTRKGFGSRLLERGLAGDLRGQVEVRYEPDGLVCRIEAPLERDARP